MLFDFLVAVGALLLGAGSMLRMLAFHGIARGTPGRQATAQCPRFPSLLSKELRHTGAGALIRSSAIGDDRAVLRNRAEVLEDL